MSKLRDQFSTDGMRLLSTKDLKNEKIDAIEDNFALALNTLEKDLKKAIKARESKRLTTDQEIKIDTYIAYATSTLYWMHLKLKGVDISKHYILHDLARAKDCLARDKELNDSKSMQHLDIQATQRFIARGLHTRFVDMNGVMVTEEQYRKSLDQNK
ncbi:Rrp47 [Drosophila busckii]|uniref:Nuclear nucleic acid-binding protein C1D n=2 Tax=Drosophila busckii TaxID=30019 RepID=A0A0M4EWA7_DROBS|nr:Rrp47 [Drosophila busckii]